MRNFFTIWKRELTACFLSPIAYVTMVVFLAASGGTFLMGVMKNVGCDQPIATLLFAAVIVWMTVLISVTSMRLFAEEKRSGTLETLMTAPVTDAEVVLGKYAGAMTFLLIVGVPALCDLAILARLSPGITLTTVDPGAIVAGCLILCLTSAFFMSIGLLVSLMTKNQIVAAICCFCAIWLVLLSGNIITAMPIHADKLVEFVSPLVHVDDFARGSIDTRPIALYLSGTVFMLFTAIRVLESRRWK